MYHKNLNNKISIRCSIKQYDKLCIIAAARKITVSNLIRYIISDYLNKY